MIPAGNCQSPKIMQKSAIEKVSNDSSRRQPIENDIVDIASKCSYFAHTAVRISSTAEARLKSNTTNPHYASLKEEMFIGMGDDLYDSYLDKIDVRIEARRENIDVNSDKKEEAGLCGFRAFVQAFAEHLIDVLVSNEGNCLEKAALAGLFIKATILSDLKQSGFTDEEINAANIKVHIKDNIKSGGDHCVCNLTYDTSDADRRSSLIVDPWMNGTVYRDKNMQHVYDENLIDPNESCNYANNLLVTKAVNNKECVTAVMNFAKEIFGDEPEFSDLFKYQGDV